MENKKQILFKKNLIAILVGILPIFHFVVALALSTQYPVDNASADKKKSPAVIRDILVYEGGTTITPQSLTPQKDYDIKIKVTENNGIGNSNGGLDELIVKLWYDKDGNDVLLNNPKSFFATDKLSPQNCLKIRWVRGGNALLSGGGLTWKLDLKKSILPNTENDNDTTFEFVFNVKIGKVAREASVTSKWQIAAKVVDVDELTDYKMFKGIAGTGLPMDFYEEIIMDMYKLDINNISKGNQSGDIIHEVKDIRYLANGNYDELIKADNVWVDINNSSNIMLRLYGAQIENTFALKSNSINDMKTAKILPINQTNLSIKKNVPASTSEQPETKSNFLYLSLNPNFNKIITYQGTITYGIGNNVN